MIDIDGIKRQNLKRFLEEFKIKRTDFAEKMGFSAQYLSVLLKGTRTVSPELIEKASEEYAVEEQYFYRGLYNTNHEDFVLIPKYKAVLSAGDGSFDNKDQISSYFAFRKEWIKQRGNPKNFVLVLVRGDSMSPTICHNDMVLVDKSKTGLSDIIDGKIHAIRENDVIKIKRLYISGKKIKIKSDNEIEGDSYEIDIEEEDFHLIGRIIWVGHEF